ncbi:MULTISPECIES: FAD-dependent oxidoreductase [Nocardia]|uniref:NAD(P)/FAD-dependent oxidoreductase n=1 Tax=Nocardia implantans TaxID=3108168 RepID=A0ABU6AYI3_9NOCA|nr:MULTISPECIES: NAD(P)/FAD-dependent oxidoreductase [unclassified Nocardia]MBF6194366.1 FAD-dependent monooxygenase [Nocardia beijingensis]MEA3529974.1 NAD(P)/FAD-dependent oxidoreductase [Nocardia sp. CDC192]MEB3512548.1 NAD(P)/FAD-dependent oxidoreductase [Nocardia sp. CDC186]
MFRAEVIGCGIGGACAALAMAKVGVRVQVYEHATRAADVGGWVTLGPAASTALDQIGLGERVRAAGFPVVGVSTVDTVTGRASSFPRTEPGHRWSSTHVWRRDLLAVLREGLDRADISCDYGTRADPGGRTGDLLVGADGARSATRRMLGDRREPTYTGQSIRYGHFPEPVRGLPTNVLHFWSHPDGVVGYVGDDRDGSFWFSRRNVASAATVTDPDVFLDALRVTPVAEVLERSEVSAPIALYELEPEGRWHNADTVLIGDAAHAVSPAAGRGATSAIEDAIVLAKALRSANSIAAALDSYTEVRRPIAQATFRPGAAPRIPAADLRL